LFREIAVFLAVKNQQRASDMIAPIISGVGNAYIAGAMRDFGRIYPQSGKKPEFSTELRAQVLAALDDVLGKVETGIYNVAISPIIGQATQVSENSGPIGPSASKGGSKGILV
jgi:hypothetical protein